MIFRLILKVGFMTFTMVSKNSLQRDLNSLFPDDLNRKSKVQKHDL